MQDQEKTHISISINFKCQYSNKNYKPPVPSPRVKSPPATNKKTKTNKKEVKKSLNNYVVKKF